MAAKRKIRRKSVKRILAFVLGMMLLVSLQGTAFASEAAGEPESGRIMPGQEVELSLDAEDAEDASAQEEFEQEQSDEEAPGEEMPEEGAPSEEISDTEETAPQESAQEPGSAENTAPEGSAEEPEDAEPAVPEEGAQEAEDAESHAAPEAGEGSAPEDVVTAVTETEIPDESTPEEEVQEPAQAEALPEENTEKAEEAEDALPEEETVTGAVQEGTPREPEDVEETATDADMQEPAGEAEIVAATEEETDSLDPMMAAGSGSADTPEIALTFVPEYGRHLPLVGYIYKEGGGTYTTSDYRITVFLQVSEGGNYYVKPTNATPYVDLYEDGVFSLDFISGGNDITAKVLHVMLIPSSYTPNGSGEASFRAAENAALDYVKITRTEDGEFTLDKPERYHEVPPPETTVLPVSSSKIAVNVGFYTDGSFPGSPLSVTLIKQQLEMVKPFANVVRFYSSGGEVQKAYAIARSMGLSVVGTAWLSGNANDDKAELDALIQNCNDGNVQVACVGSETLLRHDLTAAKLIQYIQYVRERLTDKSIPVTTADNLADLVKNRNVLKECDLIMPNCYPFWEGKNISDAGRSFSQSIEYMQAVCRDKQIIVSETGWPTAGQSKVDAVAGEEESAQYFQAVRTWSRTSGTQVLWFDAADEPWKRRDEGEAGANWGLMTTDFVLKSGYSETTFFKAVASKTVDISKAKVTGIVDKTYTGSALTQNPVVKFGQKTLKKNTDYKLTYQNNVNAGTATVTITAIGKDGLGRKYTGSISETFTIKKAAQSLTAAASAARTAVGETCTISVTGAQGTVSFASSDTSVAAVAASSGKVTAKKAGEATITVTSAATANYTAASAKTVVKIVPGATTSLIASNLAAGIKLTWKPVEGAIGYRVYWGDNLLAKITGKSTVTYIDTEARSNGSKYTYKVFAEGAAGVSTLYTSRVAYRLARPSVTSVRNVAEGRLKVEWDQNTKGTGYQLQCSLVSDFSDTDNKAVIRDPATLSRVISGLTKGKTYYVRVRTYKTVGSTEYYSCWSLVKSAKVEK